MTARRPADAGRTRTAPSAQLPHALTSFVGRASELARLRPLLGSSRLVTLTGSGGSGKTRLAQELAASVAEDFGGEVYWAELGPLSEGELVTAQVSEVLGLPGRKGEAGYAAIAGHVGDRRCLLVVDNCEHVLKDAAALVVGLLARARHLVVLATSREALSIPGETAWLVPPLSLPEAADAPTPASLEASEAVRLFLDRASDVVPTFRATEANAADIAAICRRLDGIPLALELAAARLRTLGPAQLLARLDDRFRILTTRAPTALPRHRTLRAAIDWSYGLLSATERLLLNRLSVFAGSFDLEAAEYICADDAIAYEDVLDLVSDLVEKSLVEVVEHESQLRYRLLETVRQYAAERMAAEGLREDANRQHAEYFLAVVEAAEPHFTEPGRKMWIDRLTRDADNLRQALAWTRTRSPAAHIRLAGKLGWYWFGTEHWAEGRRWLEEALALPAAAPRSPERVTLLFALGVLTALQGHAALARPVLRESLALAEDLADPRGAAYARLYLGLSLAAEGGPEAPPLLEDALAFFRSTRDLYGGRLALLCLGALEAAEGHLDRAAEMTEGALEAARAFGQYRELSVSLRQLSIVELRRDDPARAARLAVEALEAVERDPQHYFIAMSLEALAGACADLGRPVEAAHLFGAGERIREEIGVAVARIDLPVYEPRIASVRSALDEAAFRGAWDGGRRLTVAEAITFGRGVGAALATAPPGMSGDASRADRAAAATVSAGTPAPDPAAAVAGLHVRALGPLEIDVEGRRLEPEAWSHARPRELLLHLLCHPAGRTRQEVGLALWPESSAAQVKNSFHVALHHLRKTLGRPEWVRIENERYRVSTELGVRFDAVEFEGAVRAGVRAARDGSEAGLDALRAALALYRGDFLADESVGDWHLELRDHLRRLLVDGMLALGDALLRTAAHEEAIEIGRRAVLADDLHEAAHRQLMIGYARTGERLQAIRQFERLSTLLRDELDAEPEPETVALHRRILAAEPV